MTLGRIALLACALLVAAPGVVSRHDDSCSPSYADPATYRAVATPDALYYMEERPHDGRYGPEGTYDVPPPTQPAPPVWGGLFGDGFWVYEETNGVPGLQRGGFSPLGPFCWPPPTLPCIIILGEDYLEDESCGHGPDQYLGP